VYRAWDPTLEREVALKLLDDDQIDRGAYLREARHLARVRHPNVVQVYGADVFNGTAGFWMELIEGQTVAAIVAEGGVMTAGEIRQLAVSISGALAAIHRAGVVHQDVKAENVIRDREGRLVLMDLGASVAETVPPGKGTPRYMAPELFLGEGASARGDIYSLGILLFFVATAMFPADGTYEEIARRHQANGRRTLRELRPDLDPVFLNTVERAMAIEPAARFATADQLRLFLTAEAV
jgi:serine/threonine-protein kinase